MWLIHCGLVMPFSNWVNISSGNDVLPNGTKPLPRPMLTSQQWMSNDNHLRAISGGLPWLSNTKISSIYLKFHLNLPGACELIYPHKKSVFCRKWYFWYKETIPFSMLCLCHQIQIQSIFFWNDDIKALYSWLPWWLMPQCHGVLYQTCEDPLWWMIYTVWIFLYKYSRNLTYRMQIWSTNRVVLSCFLD